MQPTLLVFAALLILPAVGLFTWAWFAIAQVEAGMQSFSGFDGLHFNSLTPSLRAGAQGPPWPIPG